MSDTWASHAPVDRDLASIADLIEDPATTTWPDVAACNFATGC